MVGRILRVSDTRTLYYIRKGPTIPGSHLSLLRTLLYLREGTVYYKTIPWKKNCFTIQKRDHIYSGFVFKVYSRTGIGKDTRRFLRIVLLAIPDSLFLLFVSWILQVLSVFYSAGSSWKEGSSKDSAPEVHGFWILAVFICV